jgi:hypothetical protein
MNMKGSGMVLAAVLGTWIAASRVDAATAQQDVPGGVSLEGAFTAASRAARAEAEVTDFTRVDGWTSYYLCGARAWGVCRAPIPS